MIKNRNGFGNDSHSVLLTHANGEVVTASIEDASWGGDFFYESSKGGEKHVCVLSGLTSKELTVNQFGGESWSLTGATEWAYIQCTGNTGGDDWSFGTDDFCVDFWINLRDKTLPAGDIFGSWGVYQDINNYWGLAYDSEVLSSGTGLKFIVKFGGTIYVELIWSGFAAAVTTNSFEHCAITRNGAIFRLFWNGVEYVSTNTITPYDMPDFKTFFMIGTIMPTRGDVSYMKYFNAYYDEFRISKGNGRWDRDFIVPNREF
jgi:hypothetical protein